MWGLGVAKQQVIYNLNKSTTQMVSVGHIELIKPSWYQSIYHPLIGFQKNYQSQHNFQVYSTLQWRHNERDGVSNHSIDCSIVCLGADQRKYQSSVSLAFERGIHCLLAFLYLIGVTVSFYVIVYCYQN